MYRIELLIQDEIDDEAQAACALTVGTIIDVGDDSGVGVVGRIVSVRIRGDSAPSTTTGAPSRKR